MSRFKAGIRKAWGGALLLGVLTVVALPALASTTAATSTQAPKPLKRDPPDYPKGARARGIEGLVVLGFNVDRDGNVVSPHIVSATPPGVFDAAALTALSKWKYQPSGTETENVQVNIVFKQE